MEEKRNVLGPVEKFVLLAFFLVLGYIVVKNGGCGMIERTEKIEFIEPPSNGRSGPSVPKRKDEKRQQAIEEELKRIAESLGQGSQSWSEGDVKTLSNDEKDYLQTVSKQYQLEDKIKSAGDWLYVLKTSHETYQRVKALFDRIAPDKNAGEVSRSYESIFRDDQLANTLYRELETYFNLPRDQAEDFAQKGHVTIKDWTDLIASTPNRVSEGK